MWTNPINVSTVNGVCLALPSKLIVNPDGIVEKTFGTFRGQIKIEEEALNPSLLTAVSVSRMPVFPSNECPLDGVVKC